MQCPICRKPLKKITLHGMEIDSCPDCLGGWFDRYELTDFLKKTTKDDFRWEPKEDSVIESHLNSRIHKSDFCPKCNYPVEPVSIGFLGISLLKCLGCSGMWVELSQLNALRYWYRQASPTKRLALNYQPQEKEMISRGSYWAYFFPLMKDAIPRRKFPWITLFLIVLNISISIWSFLSPDKAQFFWMVPKDVLNYPLQNMPTVLTSMFIHNNIYHLAINLIFLWAFGASMENRLAMTKYFFVYLGSGILAGLIHILLTSHPEIPTFGASGAISGIIGSYLLLYPRSRIKLFTLSGTYTPWAFRLPIWVYLLMWFFGLQLLNDFEDASGMVWYAHIAGFLFGLFALFSLRKLKYLQYFQAGSKN